MRKLPYGRLILALLAGAWAIIWFARESLELRADLVKASKDISVLLFSPDSRWLVTGSAKDQEFVVWDVGTALAKRTLTASGPNTRPTVFSDDGKLLAAGTRRMDNGTSIWDGVEVWDLEAGTSLERHQHDASFESMSGGRLYSSSCTFFDGRRLLSFNRELNKTWDWSARTWSLEFDKSFSIAGRPNGWGLAQRDKTIRVLNLKTGQAKCECVLANPKLNFDSYDISADGKTVLGLLSGPFQGGLQAFAADGVIVQVPSGRSTATTIGKRVYDGVLSPNGEWCGFVLLGKCDGVKKLSERVLSPEAAQRSPALGLFAKLIDALAPRQGAFDQLHDNGFNLCLFILPGVEPVHAVPSVFHAQFSPDGKLLATISMHGDVKLWTLPRPISLASNLAASCVVAWGVFLLVGWLKSFDSKAFFKKRREWK